MVSRERRWATIRRDHPELSLSRQCRLLSISRSSLYHAPQGESAENLELMRRIDELFLKYRFYGSRYGRPQIFNIDQGSQFTTLEFTATLKDAGVAISMDGKGRCMDNIFIVRLWRSLKYEAVYLHELSDGFQAQRVIARWIAFYNTARPHSTLADSTPTEAYDNGMLLERQAEPHPSPAPLPAQPEHEDLLNRSLRTRAS